MHHSTQRRHAIENEPQPHVHIFTPLQTKILEGWTTFQNELSMHFSMDVSTGFGLQNVERCFPGKRILKCSSDLPKSSFGEHKTLKFIHPKRRFWKEEQNGLWPKLSTIAL
jgi:hypothetical protein